jgi:hypothetical protein
MPAAKALSLRARHLLERRRRSSEESKTRRDKGKIWRRLEERPYFPTRRSMDDLF